MFSTVDLRISLSYGIILRIRMPGINVAAKYASRDRYYRLYNSVYDNLLEMEKSGQISIEPGSKQ